MTRPVLFFGETDGNARLCRRIALGLRRLGHDDIVFVDTSGLYGFRAGGDLFAAEGWRVVPFGTRSGRGDLLPEALELLRAHAPSAVVIPHEWDYAAAVMRAALALGVASYEYQHGDYWPSTFVTGGADEVRLQPITRPRLRERQRQLLVDQLDIFRQAGRAVAARMRAKPDDTDDPLVAQLRREPFRQGYFFRADRVGVGGDYYRRRLLELGVAPDRIDVTGYLKTDELFDAAATEAELLARFGLEGAPFAVYLYAPIQEGRSIGSDPIEAVAAACDAVHRLRPSWGFLVLNHPRTPAIFDRLRATRPFVRIGEAGPFLWGLTAAAKLVLGAASSTLTEALVSSTPILMQRYVTVEEAHTVPYEGNAVVAVHHPLHLGEQIERALNDRDYVDFTVRNRAHVVRELLGPVDGKCGDRAALGVLEAIRRRSSAA